MNLEVLKILTDWTKRTEMILRLEKDRWKVGQSGALDRSMSHRVIPLSDSHLEAQLDFLVRGRFVDMGAGRARKIESQSTNGELLNPRKRKPKRWYSRAYYGRINDLQGILGYQLMESAINSVKDPLQVLSSGNVGNPSKL